MIKVSSDGELDVKVLKTVKANKKRTDTNKQMPNAPARTSESVPGTVLDNSISQPDQTVNAEIRNRGVDGHDRQSSKVGDNSGGNRDLQAGIRKSETRGLDEIVNNDDFNEVALYAIDEIALDYYY